MTIKDTIKNIVSKGTHKLGDPPTKPPQSAMQSAQASAQQREAQRKQRRQSRGDGHGAPTGSGRVSPKTILHEQELAIPLGSLVVVTGASGYIGSHIVDQLLFAGYRVRGTVRDLVKSEWVRGLMAKRHGSGRFELVEVPDMAAEGAFKDAVRGAAGLVHSATPVLAGTDPHKVIPPVVKGTTEALDAAMNEPGIQRFVLTSSSGAAITPTPGEAIHVSQGTWNEPAVHVAYDPYQEEDKARHVYYASKTKGEQAAWAWLEENKPAPFVFNAVLPSIVFGPILDVAHQGFSGSRSRPKDLFDSGWAPIGAETLGSPPQYYVNVVDVAAVHVAALMYPGVKNERLFAWAHPTNWNDVLARLRKMYPHKIFAEDIPGLGQDHSTVANIRAEDLLKRLKGHGWTSLEETLRDNLAGL